MISFLCKRSLVVALGLAVSPALAITTTWLGVTSGNVTDPTNWSAGVPGAADEAIVVTAPNAPDLLGSSVTWGKLTLNGATDIADSVGGATINLNNAGTALFSAGTHSSTIAPALNIVGNIQTNGEHNVAFNGPVTAAKVESFGTAIATYNNSLTITNSIVTIGATAEVVINNVLNWNFPGEKGYNGGGGAFVLGAGSTVNLNIFNLFDLATVRTDANYVLTGGTDLWGRHANSTLDLNGYSQGLEFLATNAGSNMVIDFGSTTGANTLIWDASHNSGGTYDVVNFEAGVDTLEFGQYGSGLAFHDPALLARITVNGAAYAASNPGGGLSWWNAVETPNLGDDPGRQIAVFYAAVPEPTSLLLAGAAALLVGFRRSN
jgi:hypothetical protein